MSQSQEPIGDIIGVPLAVASGLHVDMTEAGAVSFICFEDDGSTIATLKESTGTGTTEQNLVVIDKVYKFPGTGGTATKVTQTAAATYDNADDTVNDAFVFTVYASDLSDGFTHLEVTVDGGTVMALQHSLRNKRAAANMATQIG